jgi:hypothetical protein
MELLGSMVSRRTIRFYSIWFLIALGILGLIFLTLAMLEWRVVYKYTKWYRQHPAEEERFTGVVARSPMGEDWIKLFVTEGEVTVVDRDLEAPPGVQAHFREYSYRLVLPGGEEIDIYGAGADVRQVRLLNGVQVEIDGKRTWFELNGVRIKEELWPARIRVSREGADQPS